ncbi:protein ARV1-like [Ptychodera flava]|uniref:protein ARV1-like n=1 Tax=Ptychodera flava TaxID=63121 RepID=UPI00396A6CA5
MAASMSETQTRTNRYKQSDENNDGIDEYVCIECGTSATELYRYFSGNVLKISHCEKCGKAVDKYIEFDPVIILLDAILHKTQAYRHILYNSKVNVHWKLCVLCMLCDAYMKWSHHKAQNADGTKDFLYYALEWDYYAMFLIAGLEFSTFMFGVIIACRLFLPTTNEFSATYPPSLSLQIRALMLSSSGKLLVIPAVIWGQSNRLLLLWLTSLFVFTSSVQSIKVLFQRHTLLCCLTVLSGYAVQLLTQQFVTPYLEMMFMD